MSPQRTSHWCWIHYVVMQLLFFRHEPYFLCILYHGFILFSWMKLWVCYAYHCGIFIPLEWNRAERLMILNWEKNNLPSGLLGQNWTVMLNYTPVWWLNVPLQTQVCIRGAEQLPIWGVSELAAGLGRTDPLQPEEHLWGGHWEGLALSFTFTFIPVLLDWNWGNSLGRNKPC